MKANQSLGMTSLGMTKMSRVEFIVRAVKRGSGTTFKLFCSMFEKLYALKMYELSKAKYALHSERPVRKKNSSQTTTSGNEP